MKKFLLAVTLVFGLFLSSYAATYTPVSYPKFRAYKPGTSTPLVGGQLYTYTPGTTIPVTTYKDVAGVSQNTNPIILDANGEAALWYNGYVKLVLYDSTGVVVWTQDNFPTSQITQSLAGDNTGDLSGYVNIIGSGTGSITGFSIPLYLTNYLSVNDALTAWTDIRAYDGCLGDDTTDCTNAVEQAIDNLTAGGTIYFPKGTYRISNITGLENNVTGINFVGDGEYATHFRVTSTTGNVFDLTGARFVTFKGFGFTPTSTERTDGYLFYMSGASDIYLNRLRIGSMHNGFYFGSSSSGITLEDIKGTDYGSHTWNRFVYVDGVNSSLRLKRVGITTANVMTDNAFTLAYNGGAVDTFVAENIYAQKTASGLIPVGLSIQGGDFVHITTSFFECGSASSEGIEITGGNDIHLNDVHASTNYNGLSITGGDGIYVNGGRFYYNAREGIKITGGAHVSIYGADINDNSEETTNTYDGIYIAAGVSEWKVVANTIGKVRGDAPASTHRYGIYVADGASDQYAIIGNLITDYGSSKGIYDGGYGLNGVEKIVHSNPGAAYEDTKQNMGFVTTTNDTPTTLWTKTLADETIYYIEADVLASYSGGGAGYAFTRKVLVSRDGGGGATILGAVDNTTSIRYNADTSGCTFTVSDNNVNLVVTGIAGVTFKWSPNVRIMERLSGT